jgi:hypothetical protein
MVVFIPHIYGKTGVFARAQLPPLCLLEQFVKESIPRLVTLKSIFTNLNSLRNLFISGQAFMQCFTKEYIKHLNR